MLFTTVEGRTIWAPVEKVVFMEQGAGGLTTAVHLFPMVGQKGMGMMIVEVEGLVKDHGPRVDAARKELLALGQKPEEVPVPA